MFLYSIKLQRDNKTETEKDYYEQQNDSNWS